MVNSFAVAATPNIIFGVGKRKELAKLTQGYGNTIALVLGKSSFVNSTIGQELMQNLVDFGITIHQVEIPKEPTPELIDKAVEKLRNQSIKAVVAIGGGAVLDAGKAIAAMLCHEDSIVNYLEGIGTKETTGNTLPFIAVPTTSGTGSEATKNAVISSIGENGFKKSLRHDNFVPKIALVDPELTLTCPRSLTAASGMDAFTQLLESLVSNNASAFTDSLAIKGLSCIKEGLQKAVFEGDNLEARTNMSYAALISGITLANAGLGTVHGFASSVGGYFNIPHGVVCGTMMGATNRVTVEKIRNESKGEYALQKYVQVGKLFAGHHSKSEAFYIDFLLDLIDEYTNQFVLDKLSVYEVTSADFEKIIKATGNKNNPVALNKDELFKVLEMSS